MIKMDSTLQCIKSCQMCSLQYTRYHVVLGRGSLPCKILFLGEGPGKSEDLLGQAFIGESGKLLDRMCFESGLTFYKLYYTNIVLCYPTGKKGGKNREPEVSEVSACMENVLYIVGQANPEIIVFVGDIAKHYYNKVFPEAIHIQHPSFLLQTGGIQSPYYLKNIRILEGVNKCLQ